ncbi:osmolarity response regulator [Klebsiella pneumoniae]|uniref:DNA-binding dual transcriptional regulator OmpR n=1 Tax=Klebsiella pneumoniae TaxID=573 RepID=A0A2X3CPD8_KLEPN|nr:osmolarity response regulator [Klebsiella pneumoniae]
MQENYKILVVDDDMRLRALLERYLTEQGFQVRSVANAEQMDRLLTRESFHLMVLDLMLPGEDGLSICRRLRSQSNPMPIIMVTAKGEEVDRIVGLEIGLTTIFRSRLTRANCWPASGRCCAARRTSCRARRRRKRRLSPLVNSN